MPLYSKQPHGDTDTDVDADTDTDTRHRHTICRGRLGRSGLVQLWLLPRAPRRFFW